MRQNAFIIQNNYYFTFRIPYLFPFLNQCFLYFEIMVYIGLLTKILIPISYELDIYNK